ncbi:MAG: thioredoxin family protein [Magnetococcales bacterium]|nr:thioredoxin family protein [Magnetococcales bacterium]
MALLHTPPGDLGSPAAPFSLPGVDGRTWSLSDFSQEAVLVVMFICNHCPYVQAIEERLIRLARELQPRGARFVGINSNDTVAYPEDSFDNMKKRAKQKGYPFLYLLDATQEVARSYGAVCTPDFFVYDSQRTLRYRGRLDDSPRNEDAVTRQEMREAILALLEGKTVAEPQNPAMGCSMKWKD